MSWGSPPPWHPSSMCLQGLSALASSTGNSSRPWQSPLGGFSASRRMSASTWATEGFTSASGPATWKPKVEEFVKKMDHYGSFARVPFSRWTCSFFLEAQILRKSSQSQSLSQVKLHPCLRILWWPRPLWPLWPLCCLGVWMLLEPVLHCFSAASGGLHAPWCGIQLMPLKHGHTKAGLLVATAGKNQRHTLHCLILRFNETASNRPHLGQ